MIDETLAEALERISTMKKKLSKWERKAIARYKLAVEAGDIEYDSRKRLTRGTAVMLGGKRLLLEEIKQLEEERIARMKIHAFKIDLSMFRHTEYLRKFHAILNETDDASIIVVQAEYDKQAVELAQERIRKLVGHWSSAEAIEDATWSIIPLGTINSAHCAIACEGHGYYYSADVTLKIDFNTHSPIRCVPVTGETEESAK